jgi:hypothetical protein
MGSFDKADWGAGAPRRILGMKIWQAALLIGLAVMDCLVVVAGTAVVIGSISSASPKGAAASLAPTSTPKLQSIGPTLAPTPSETPLTMVFQFPTYTPFGTPADTPTFTPTSTDLFEGWVKFFVPEVEIWMPATYAAGDPHTEAKAIIASLKEKGANFDWDVIEKEMTTLAKNYVLWGIDSRQGNPAVVTIVAVAYDFPNPGESLPAYTTRFVSAISNKYLLIEQQKVNHPEYEVERAILETKDPSATPMRLALYAVRDGNIVWVILCYTAVDEMKERLPSFNQMVDTFRVLAAPQ